MRYQASGRFGILELQLVAGLKGLGVVTNPATVRPATTLSSIDIFPPVADCTSAAAVCEMRVYGRCSRVGMRQRSNPGVQPPS